MEQYPRLFLAVEVLSVFVFVVGILANLGFWFKGSLTRTNAGSFGERLSFLTSALYKVLFARGFFRLFYRDILLEKTLLREDPTRWPMHFPLALGFCILFFIGSLGDQFTDWGILEIGKDEPWFAFVNDAAGILLLVGLLLALHRRYVLKLPYLKTFLDDKILVLLLLASLVSGYVVEGLRLLSGALESRASFIGASLATIFSPLDLDWTSSHLYTWWFHALVSLAFFSYIPFSRVFHLFATPLTLMLNSLDHRQSFVSIDPNGNTPNFTLKQLIEFSGCTRCGECLRVCETYKNREVDPIAPAVKLKDIRGHLLHKYGPRWASRFLGGRKFSEQDLFTLSEAAFRCTLCGYCTHVCPSKIDLQNLWYSIRQEYSTGVSKFPKGFTHLKDGVANEGNIFNYPNVERALWVDFMGGNPSYEGLQKPKAKVLYFVGCVSSFSPLAQDIPQAFAALLIRAGVDFTILGPEEFCCGFPLKAAGMKDKMEGLRRHNIKKLREIGADTVVFNCPSCYMTWDNEYSPFLEGVKLKHSTQFIKELLKEGRLKPSQNKLKVTYHDPCDLGRNVGVYESPREVLRAIPGIDFRETRNHKSRAICCGGGGVLEAADPIMASEISYSTYNTFLETGAEALVVACPQCKRMFHGARKHLEGRLQVMDITELLLKSI
ncbi:MAG: (Fe-S)-binding protein [Candidatus Brocadiales bacterium]